MIEIKNMTKTYEMGDVTVKALDDVSLTINTGEYVAIIGPSGSGKSTLMNMLGALDTPTTGQYFLNGKDVSQMNETQLAKERNKNIGFVFQRYNLLGRVSSVRNVELPARYGGLNGKDRYDRAVEAMTAVGLGNKLKNKPVELSGGQQQRVAIARALVNQPTILLADEPTGALDSKTGKEVLDLFGELHRTRGITVIIVTHDPTVARRARRIISIKDGRIESDLTNTPSAMGGHDGHDSQAVSQGASQGAMAQMASLGQSMSSPVAVAERVETVAAPMNGHVAVSVNEVVAPSAPAFETEEIKVKPQPKHTRILLMGLLALVLSAAINIGIAYGAKALGATALPMLNIPPIAVFTVVGVLGAILVFALMNRFGKRPARAFTVVAFIVLLLSLVPDVLIGTGQLAIPTGGQRTGAFTNGTGTGQTQSVVRTITRSLGFGRLGGVANAAANGVAQDQTGPGLPLAAGVLALMHVTTAALSVTALTKWTKKS